MNALLSSPVLLQDRFAATLRGLCEEANAHGARDRLMAPLLGLLCRRLYGVMAHITRTLARLQAGRAPTRRQREVSTHPRPLAGREGSSETVRPRYGWAWMIRMAPRVAQYAPQLQVLLDEPEMQVALAASPSLRRALRPLCRGLAFPAPAVMVEARRTRRSQAGVEPIGTQIETAAEASSAAPPVVVRHDGAPSASTGLSVPISNHHPPPHHHPGPGGPDSPGMAPWVLRAFTR